MPEIVFASKLTRAKRYKDSRHRVGVTDCKRGSAMNSWNILARQGHRLLQIGVALFLFTSLEGFAIPYFASPIVGRSVHNVERAVRPYTGSIWPAMAQAPPRRRACTYRILV